MMKEKTKNSVVIDPPGEEKEQCKKCGIETRLLWIWIHVNVFNNLRRNKIKAKWEKN